jgi:hypothetical protein
LLSGEELSVFGVIFELGDFADDDLMFDGSGLKFESVFFGSVGVFFDSEGVFFGSEGVFSRFDIFLIVGIVGEEFEVFVGHVKYGEKRSCKSFYTKSKKII